MVSFDVIFLFTSIPTAFALQVTKNRLEADPTNSERTKMPVDTIKILLQFVARSHQSLNMFKSYLVKHGFLTVFFIKAAY